MPNLRADAGPSEFESTLAVSALEASASRHALKPNGSIQPTEANLVDGARLYRDKCADCHGRPDNPDSDYGRSFYPRAPQFVKVPPRMTDHEKFYIIKHGVRWTAMPAWGNITADSEIAEVVTFLNHIGNRAVYSTGTAQAGWLKRSRDLLSSLAQKGGTGSAGVCRSMNYLAGSYRLPGFVSTASRDKAFRVGVARCAGHPCVVHKVPQSPHRK